MTLSYKRRGSLRFVTVGRFGFSWWVKQRTHARKIVVRTEPQPPILFDDFHLDPKWCDDLDRRLAAYK
jgi:hypothetical protein